MTRPEWTDDDAEAEDYEERAAIVQYDGGRTRAEAERIAREIIEAARGRKESEER